MDHKKGVYERGDAGGMGEIFFKFLKLHNNKVSQIIVDTDEEDTFSDILLRSVRTALALRKTDDINPEDVIGVYSHNHINSCIPFIASQFLGAIPCHFDTKMSTEIDVYLLKQIQPKLIITTSDKIEQLEECLERANLKVKLIVFEETEGYAKFSDYLVPQENEESFVPYHIENNETTAVIIFSSGTTGPPKGVCLSHYALIRQRDLENYIFVSDVEDSIFTTLLYTTLFWMSAVLSLTISLIQGNCRIICSKFDPAQAWDIIEKYKVNLMFLVPFQAQEFLNNRPNRDVDLSSLHGFWVGAYTCPKQILDNLITALPNALITNAYGQTEAGVITSHDFSSMEGIEMAKKKCLSVGRVQRGFEWKVVDPETEKRLGPNERGELRVKSDFIMNGYYNMDSAQVYDSEGFLKIGDIVYYDEDNYVFIVDRLSEMFKTKNGDKIFPSILEEILLSHPAVKEAVIIGVADQVAGLCPMGIVVLNEHSSDVTPKDIELFFEKKVNDAQRLRAGVKIVQEFPKTASDKIRRREVKKMVMDGEI